MKTELKKPMEQISLHIIVVAKSGEIEKKGSKPVVFIDDFSFVPFCVLNYFSRF
jgi:hypothetical protein